MANAPFGNGVAPYVNQMCSDFFDFFTIKGGSALRRPRVPLDNNSNCNTNTLNAKRIGWITDLTQCTPVHQHGVLERGIDPGRVNIVGQNLVVTGLTVTELGGTPFVAGNVNGLDPTAIGFQGIAARSNASALSIALIAFGGLMAVLILWQVRRRQSHTLSLVRLDHNDLADCRRGRFIEPVDM